MDFKQRPTVNGVNVLLSGEGGSGVTLADNNIWTGTNRFNKGIGVYTNNAVFGTELLGGGFRLQQLDTPAAPTITRTGTNGTTTYQYYVLPRDFMGREGQVSPVGQTTLGPATLSETNYNTVTWSAIPGAATYDVFRGNTTSRIATGVTGTTINDTGVAATTTAALWRNQTGDLIGMGFVGVGTQYPEEKFHVQGGNLLFKNAGETQIAFVRTDLTDAPTFKLGRIIIGGDGSPNFRVLFSDDVTAERTVLNFDDKGILAAIHPTGTYAKGSFFEGFVEGDVQTYFRLSNFPEMQLEMGPGGTTATDTAIRRSGTNELSLVVGATTTADTNEIVKVTATGMSVTGKVTATTYGGVPRTVAGWFLSGTYTTGTQGPVVPLDSPMTIDEIRIVGTEGKLPTATVEVDIEWWNGTSYVTIFSTRPTLASGARLGGTNAVFSKTSFAKDDLLRINTISASGQDVSVYLRGKLV